MAREGHTIEQQLTARRLQQPQQQVSRRGLAPTRCPHQGNACSDGNGEIHIIENPVRRVAIAISDVLQLDRQTGHDPAWRHRKQRRIRQACSVQTKQCKRIVEIGKGSSQLVDRPEHRLKGSSKT